MVENVLGDRRPFFLTSALHVAPKSVFGVRLGTRRVRSPRNKKKKGFTSTEACVSKGSRKGACASIEVNQPLLLFCPRDFFLIWELKAYPKQLTRRKQILLPYRMKISHAWPRNTTRIVMQKKGPVFPTIFGLRSSVIQKPFKMKSATWYKLNCTSIVACFKVGCVSVGIRKRAPSRPPKRCVVHNVEVMKAAT